MSHIYIHLYFLNILILLNTFKLNSSSFTKIFNGFFNILSVKINNSLGIVALNKHNCVNSLKLSKIFTNCF